MSERFLGGEKANYSVSLLWDSSFPDWGQIRTNFNNYWSWPGPQSTSGTIPPGFRDETVEALAETRLAQSCTVGQWQSLDFLNSSSPHVAQPEERGMKESIP